MIKSLTNLFNTNESENIKKYQMRIKSLEEDKSVQDSIINALELALAELKIKLDNQTTEYMIVLAAICLQNNGELYLEQDNVQAISDSTASLRMKEVVRATKKCFKYYLEETKPRKKKKECVESDCCGGPEILDEAEKDVGEEETEE